MVQPDSMSDDLGGKAMAVVRLRWWLDTVTVARVRSRCQTRLPMGWTPPDGIDVPEWGVDDTT